jgi:hypothetical protein
LARIFAADAGESLPFETIWVARAFAFAAWLLSGIGYFREPGMPNALDFSLLRVAARNSAITVLL